MTGTLSSLSPYAKCLVAAEAALPLAGRALISYYLSVSYSLWMEEDKPHLHFCVTVSPLAVSSIIFRDLPVIFSVPCRPLHQDQASLSHAKLVHFGRLKHDPQLAQ